MVNKQSEYRRQFRRKNFVKNIPTYGDNVSYRTTRREAEQAHTPFSWEEDGEVDYESVYSDEQDNITPVIYKHHQDHGGSSNRQPGYSDRVEDLRPRLDNLQLSADSEHENDAAGHTQMAPSNDKFGTKTFKIPENGSNKTVDMNNNAVKTSSVPGPRKSRLLPHRGTRIQRLCNQRASSTPARRVKKMSDVNDGLPPFVPFGWADGKRDTGNQRTHNIKASSAVYCSALKAQRKREIESDQNKSEVRRAAQRCWKAQDLRELAFSNQPSSWESEYRGNYHIYEASQYHSQRSFRPSHPKEFLPAK